MLPTAVRRVPLRAPSRVTARGRGGVVVAAALILGFVGAIARGSGRRTAATAPGAVIAAPRDLHRVAPPPTRGAAVESALAPILPPARVTRASPVADSAAIPTPGPRRPAVARGGRRGRRGQHDRLGNAAAPSPVAAAPAAASGLAAAVSPPASASTPESRVATVADSAAVAAVRTAQALRVETEAIRRELATRRTRLDSLARVLQAAP